jgi:DNA-directed RNA polymerase subunit RPC12/RpoP
MTGIHAYTREEQISDQQAEPMVAVPWLCRGCHTYVDAVVIDERSIERVLRCPECGDKAIVPDDTMDSHLERLEQKQ